MKTKHVGLGVMLFLLVGCSAQTAERDTQIGQFPDEFRDLLQVAGGGDMGVRRRAAADLCIAVLKRNGVWRTASFDGRIPTESGIRMEVDGVRTSEQTPDLAIANMCAHCMGMLKSGSWRTPPVEKSDALEKEVISLTNTADDPVVRTILLVGLASSPTVKARDAIVAATADADLGVRKSANYLVQDCSANYFGPIGVIHIGSPATHVDAAGERIREMYRTDKTLSGKIR